MLFVPFSHRVKTAHRNYAALSRPDVSSRLMVDCDDWYWKYAVSVRSSDCFFGIEVLVYCSG
jgi:hypothetical protein